MKIMEYVKIYNEFKNNEKFMKLEKENHHGCNRLAHTKRVAKLSYKLSNYFDVDQTSVTRGALMHDFFLDEELKNKNLQKKYHPLVAFENSNEYFKVNEIEEDIIKGHMYPIVKVKPTYKESKIVCISDRIVSIYEFFRYQLYSYSTICIIFLIEFLK